MDVRLIDCVHVVERGCENRLIHLSVEVPPKPWLFSIRVVSQELIHALFTTFPVDQLSVVNRSGVKCPSPTILQSPIRPKQRMH